MPFSSYLANRLLDHTFVNTAYPPPVAWWAQLHYGDPGDLGANNVWSAPGRKQVSDWTTSTLGTLSNVADIKWTELADPGANPEITHVSIHSLVTGGVCYGSGELVTHRIVAEGDQFTILVGGADISVV